MVSSTPSWHSAVSTVSSTSSFRCRVRNIQDSFQVGFGAGERRELSGIGIASIGGSVLSGLYFLVQLSLCRCRGPHQAVGSPRQGVNHPRLVVPGAISK